MQKIKEYFKNNWILLLNLLIYPLILFVPLFYQKIYVEGTLEASGYTNFYQFFSFVNEIYTIFNIFLIIGFILYFCYILILVLKSINHYKLYKYKKYYSKLMLLISFCLLIITFSLLIIMIIFVTTQKKTMDMLSHYYYLSLGTPILFLYSLINFTITNSAIKRKKI